MDELTNDIVSNGFLKLLNDKPIGGGDSSRKDGLGFSNYSKIIANTIRGTLGPFTIGIYGEWGTGKTSLLKLIKDDLSNSQDILTVWFNAWMYEKEEHPLLPLLATLISEINNPDSRWNQAKEIKQLIIKTLKSIAYGLSTTTKFKIPGFAEIEASFVAKDIFDQERNLSSDPLLDKTIYYKAFERLSTIKIPDDKKIVIIIDDLDRCFPDQAIKLLESIKLVFDQSGFIFILGVARKVIEGFLEHRYKNTYGLDGYEGHKYLDKIVQLAFPIPPHEKRIDDYSDVLLQQIDIKNREAINPLIKIIGMICFYNPRSIVRFINNLIIDKYISQNIDPSITDSIVSYCAISRGLQMRWGDVFNILVNSTEKCYALSRIDLSNLDISQSDPIISDILEFLQEDEDLAELLNTSEAKKWLSNVKQRTFAINFLNSQRLQDSQVDGGYTPTRKVRIYKMAAEYNLSTDAIISYLRSYGKEVKSHMDALTEEDIEKIKTHFYNDILKAERHYQKISEFQKKRGLA